jgi:hypothetical protein
MTFSVASRTGTLSGQAFKIIYEFGTTLARDIASDEVEGDQAYEKIR